MPTDSANVKKLLAENEELRARLAEAEDALRAIRSGEVDALVVEGGNGPQIFTLQGLDAETSRFRGEILSQISDSVVATDEEGLVTYLNAAAEKRCGVQMSEALGRPLSTLWSTQWLHEEDEASSLASLRDTDSWRGENIHITRNGSKIHVESAVIRLRDANGRPIGSLATIRDITERKRSEEKLEIAARQLRLMTDTAPVLLAHCDREHRYKFVNEPYAVRLGLRREQVVGKRLDEVIGEAAYARIRPYVEQVLKGESLEFELDLTYGRGDTHFMRCAYEPERDAAGEIVGFVAAIVDLTERKQMEEDLRRSEALYRGIGESIDYGIWVCAPDGRNVYVSDSFLKLTGLTQEQCSNFGWSHVLHPDEVAETVAAWQTCVRAGANWDREHRFRGVDGEWHPTLARGVAVKDQNGKILSWVGINLDIGAQKRAEKALRTSEANYRGLIHSLAAAVYTCDREGRIQLFNSAAVKLWGREPHVGSDHWCGSWKIFRPDGSPLNLEDCPMARTLRGGRGVRGEEIIIERPDGSRSHVLPYPDPIFDSSGNLVGAVNMLMDITELKRAEQALKQSRLAALNLMEDAHAARQRSEQAASALRESEHFLQRVNEVTPGVIHIFDLEGQRSAFVSRSISSVLGYSANEVQAMGSDIMPKLMHPEDLPRYQAHIRRVRNLENGQTADFEHRMRDRDGRWHWLQSRDAVFERNTVGDVRQIIGTAIEITSRKEAEEALARSHAELEQRVTERTAVLKTTVAALETEITERQRLEREILEISEREQCRLGLELHDDLAQQLTGLGMLAFGLHGDLVTQSHSSAEAAGQLSNALNRVLTTARHLSKSFFPVELERGGLIVALEDLAHRTEMMTRIRCSVKADADFTVDRDSAIHLYRIVQESVGNALKHAQAKNIGIECLVLDGVRTVRISDDGIGFKKLPSIGKGSGIGLHLFQYRARLLGATVEVKTRSEGRGCEVTCRFQSKSKGDS